MSPVVAVSDYRLAGYRAVAGAAVRCDPFSAYDRFTEAARQAVVLAETEARDLKFSHAGTESLLLGLLHEDGAGAEVLRSLGVELDSARARVQQRVKGGDDPPAGAGMIPFTPRAKQALERAVSEALELGHNHVGTEHLLLGLVSVEEGEAISALATFGIGAEEIRAAVGNHEFEPRVGELAPRPRRSRFNPRIARFPSREPALSGFNVALGPDVTRVLRSAAARALEDGRVAMSLRDLLIALTRDPTIARVLASMDADETSLLAALDRLDDDGDGPSEAISSS